MFCEELTNMELDEKRETKGLINYAHIVSRNTSQEEIACSSLKRLKLKVASCGDGWNRISRGNIFRLMLKCLLPDVHFRI